MDLVSNHLHKQNEYYGDVKKAVMKIIELHLKKKPDLNPQNIKDDVFNSLKYVNNLEVWDLEKALDMGYSGCFDEWYTLDGKTVLSWCNSYFKEIKSKQNILKQSTHHESKSDDTMSEEEKAKIHNEIKQILFDGYDEFRKNGMIPKAFHNYRRLFYKWFDESGLINMTVDEKKKMYVSVMGDIRKESKLDRFISEDEIKARTKRRCETQAFEKALLRCNAENIDLKEHIR